MKGPVRHIILFSSMGLIAVLLLSFTYVRTSEQLCQSFEVTITGDGLSHFVTENSVRERILDLGDPIIGTGMNDLDVARIEADLMRIPYVKEAIVYKTVDRAMEVVVTQRKPILRLIDSHGHSAYLDADGLIMETSESFTERCIPLTGKYALDDLEEAMKEGAPLEDLKAFVDHVNGDEFWSAQFVQMELDEKSELTLVPRVGVHQILLGTPEGYERKLRNLKDFYDKGITQTNWNLYQSLDLRFKDQVVCLKR